MTIDLVYFAWVREAIGRDGERAHPPEDADTVAGLVDWLATRGAGYAEALADRTRLRFALDHIVCAPGTPIAGARELAIFPPVTGG